MWPFNKSLSSSLAPDDDITEAQIDKFFSDTPAKPTYREVTTTTVDTAGNQVTKVERIEESLPVKEDPCNMQYYFDEFFMCYTPKSQLRNWYRYGEKKDCAERWRDLKWCMTTKIVDEDASQSMLRERKVFMDAKVHSGPNSEDVWDLRSEPLKAPWNGTNQDEQLSVS
ncbi:Uncharacterized protein C227.17c [Taphrina deformans PYCC 5710]|uniref:Uncharacterized protein C227.17c n=1 Tax=Taphrina deformans (strain PYCC 5710 / ATCC 11124 / CBS 356.35 / IMI 108563 / JCM 9778 / NBRC 8474) TaxID=1097556 RepID=R4X9Y8_TAPDE|nr:Uncharacterized protein C227.17c [Taphrina deformans PYCC 5710]|eukprot:CCG82587.1 Uncharacterized protein C227.17c [Taphrina deformans PYCC 5710]